MSRLVQALSVVELRKRRQVQMQMMVLATAVVLWVGTVLEGLDTDKEVSLEVFTTMTCTRTKTLLI